MNPPVYHVLMVANYKLLGTCTTGRVGCGLILGGYFLCSHSSIKLVSFHVFHFQLVLHCQREDHGGEGPKPETSNSLQGS